MAEVGLAADYHVWTLPIRVENVVPAGELKYYLSRKHWLDAMTPPIEQHLDNIRAAVESKLGSSGSCEEKQQTSSLRTPQESKPALSPTEAPPAPAVVNLV